MRSRSNFMVATIPVNAGRSKTKVSIESNTGSLSSCKSRLYAKGSALKVASSPVRFPMSLPDFPRASSATSGFFFCGMIEEPVEYASSSLMYPNSSVAQITISSAKRDKLIEIIDKINANSATTSLEAVPSIEFCVVPAKPSSLATSCGSSPRLEPPKAPAPYGDKLARERHWRNLSRSLVSGQTWANRWCESRTGCACCMCVLPGIEDPRCSSARAIKTAIKSRTSCSMTTDSERRYIRIKAAT